MTGFTRHHLAYICLCLWCACCVQAASVSLLDEADSIANWKGGHLSTEHVKSGKYSVKWFNHRHGEHYFHTTAIPHDWRPYKVLSFWVYSEHISRAKLYIKMVSDGQKEVQFIRSRCWDAVLRVTWQGWRQFKIHLPGMSPSRNPLGWDKINALVFTAKDWRAEPKENTVLYIDDMKLETGEDWGEDQRISREAIYTQHLNLDYPGLESVKEAVEAKDFDLAEERYLHYRRYLSKTVGTPDFRKMPKHAVAKTDHMAELISRNIIFGHDHGDRIDWSYDPQRLGIPQKKLSGGPGGWVRRMKFWINLGNGYWRTLNEDYAKAWIRQFRDFMETNPPPPYLYMGDDATWLALDCGIRPMEGWMSAYYYFLLSKSFKPADNTKFVEAMIWHARLLDNLLFEHSGETSNWYTTMTHGLLSVALQFPELKQSPHWTQAGMKRLQDDMAIIFYPDGAQIELTPMYHNISVRSFCEIAEAAEKNGVKVPQSYYDALKPGEDFFVKLANPMGYVTGMNDSCVCNAAALLRRRYDLWKDPTHLFVATGGKQGQEPPYTSLFMPWAGYHIMRSSWKRDALHMVFDAGPCGIGHVHEDMLNMILSAYGKMLLTEPENYTYDNSKWRSYVVQTRAHNTFTIDGGGQGRYPKYRFRQKRPLNNPWMTTSLFDYASGIYDKGYGRNSKVSHRRDVFFLKPWYFVAVDSFRGKGVHDYTGYFHLDDENAILDQRTLAVHSQDAKVRLGIYPLDPDGLKQKIVKGQENPVLGWIPWAKRPIPVVVQSKHGTTDVQFANLLYPYRGTTAPDVRIEAVSAQGTADGRCWVKNLHTPMEDVQLVLNLQPKLDALTFRSPFAVLDNVTLRTHAAVFRQEKGQQELRMGLYKPFLFKADAFEFSVQAKDISKAQLLLTLRGKDLVIKNHSEAVCELKWKKPHIEKTILEPGKTAVIKIK